MLWLAMLAPCVNVTVEVRTANLHLIPQLRFALLALLLSARLGGTLYGACSAIALEDDLASVHEAVRLETRTPCVILGCVCDTRRRRTGNLAGPYAARQALRLLLLQLFQHAFDGNGVKYVLGGSG